MEVIHLMSKLSKKQRLALARKAMLRRLKTP